MCSYMGAIGKMMNGSGLEEIIIESGVCASGSIAKVIAGKHYNRALRVHQLMLEACETAIRVIHGETELKCQPNITTTKYSELGRQSQFGQFDRGVEQC